MILNHPQVKELIDHFDVNHDGQIDRTEFALLCETRPELMTGAIRALMQEFELTTPKAVTTTQSPASEIQSGDVRVDMIPLKPDSDHK
jgi:EF hand